MSSVSGKKPKTDRQILKDLGALLDQHHIPKEVWIGTDSTYDRVVWALRRLDLIEREEVRLRDELEALQASK